MTSFEAIVNFRSALWNLAEHMGRVEFYNKYGRVVASSDWTNENGDSLWPGPDGCMHREDE